MGKHEGLDLIDFIVPLSRILSEHSFPVNCPSNALLECRSFGFFEILNATNNCKVQVAGFTNIPTTMEIWRRNNTNRTDIY